MASDNHDHLWEQIDTTCDQFELALQDGARGSIADFLIEDWPGDHRRLLLRELLDLELEYSTRSDGHIDVEKYARQFASDRDVLDNCISRHESRANRAARPAHDETQVLRQPSSVDSDDATSSVQIRDVGEFTLTGEIARGAMGIVYKAIDHSLNRTVALKVILSGKFASSEEVKRFQNEARAAALLDHPNIVPIYEVGKANGQHYFSMGLVDGHDLTSAVSQDLYAPRPAAELMVKLACAVQYAHEQGILHRDLKPANVLIDDRQEPRLTDFGLAKNLNVESTSDLTRSGQLIGTPSYMAPEQARGELDKIGRTSDVYALGAILYFVLTGRPPHRAASVAETLQQLLQEEPVSPRVFSPQVGRDLETICLTCLAKESAQRYSSCDALASDLRHYLGGDPIAARPVSAVVRWGRWCKRYPARASSLVTAALLLVAIVVGVGYRREMLSTAAGLATANQLAESRKQTADTAQFYRLLQEAAAAKARHEPGWTWRVEELLEKTNTLTSAVRDEVLLRQTILGPTTSFDLRLQQTVADDILAGSLAFSRDGQYFATGQSIDEVRPKLLVFETSNFDHPKWTFSFESEEDTQRRIARGDRKVDNGFRALCFSPNSLWLAAGTRFGKVFVGFR